MLFRSLLKIFGNSNKSFSWNGKCSQIALADVIYSYSAKSINRCFLNRSHHAREIWKLSGIASNIFHPHYAWEIWNTLMTVLTGQFGFVFWGNLAQGSHIIIRIAPLFSNSSGLKIVFEKLCFRGGLVRTVDLTGERCCVFKFLPRSICKKKSNKIDIKLCSKFCLVALISMHKKKLSWHHIWPSVSGAFGNLWFVSQAVLCQENLAF